MPEQFGAIEFSHPCIAYGESLNDEINSVAVEGGESVVLKSQTSVNFH